MSGNCDNQMFQLSRTMRLPNTKNIKKNKEPVDAYLINGTIEPQGFDLEVNSKIPKFKTTEHINPQATKKILRSLDTRAVLEGCEFLKWAKKNQHQVDEPLWYAMLGIVRQLKHGEKLVHEYSKKHPGYSPEETTRKAEQAITASGPQKCSTINAKWGKCSTCPNFNKVKHDCAIFIQGKDFIATKNTGFYETYVNQQGVPKERPCYDDLAKYLVQKHKFCTTGGFAYVYQDNYWNKVYETSKGQYLRSFAHDNFKEHSKTIRQNFQAHIEDDLIYNKPENFFDETIQGKINLQNGVFDIQTNKLLPHSDNFGFRGILPYSYDADALCPRFDQFMDEISCGRSDLQTLLLEYAGYALSNDDYRIQSALFLFGYGANGKSTYLDLLKAMAGPDNYSALTLSALKEAKNRSMLVGKMFNIGEETNNKALNKSEQFKTLSAGGEYDYHVMYKGHFKANNRAKLLFACNELPYSYDASDGLFRRLCIAPFDATFIGKADTFLIDKLKAERSGIFNKMIDAYMAIREKEAFTIPDCSLQLKNEYKEDTDSLQVWYADNMQETDGAKTLVAEAFENYKAYCRAHDLPVMHHRPNSFSRKLKEKYKLESKKESIRSNDKVKTKVYFVGLKVEAQY